MGATAKVTSKGQITLPAAMRAEFGIRPGDYVFFFRDLNGRPTFKVRHMAHEPIRPVKHWPGAAKTDEELNEGIGAAVRDDFIRADRDSGPSDEVT